MSSFTITPKTHPRQAFRKLARWSHIYLRQAAGLDFFCATVSSLVAAKLRFGDHITAAYLLLSLALPALWLAAVFLAGGYDVRFIGIGSDEFRKVFDAGVCLTAIVALFSYTANLQVSREYVIISLPGVTILDLVARYALRRWLHQLRASGKCTSTVVAVGHEVAVADLVNELSRDKYHGLKVVGVCTAEPTRRTVIADVPVYGDLDDVTAAVRDLNAHVVAVLACPEIDGRKLRSLAWELEKTGTDLCVAPALLDVAGPRTTVRQTAGLTLLHVDHPQLFGARLICKELFDRFVAAVALLVLAPVFALLSAAVRLSDGGPAFFVQTRVGKNGRTFRIYKFRTMTTDAEQRKAQLAPVNDLDGILFKLRDDPRVTTLGTHLRRWSVDELPQLVNVLLGQMSLVGPRPALPDEAARYADHVRRRLVVKPGLTGLWQVNGRSDLTWEESVRLDLRYVENWSFFLDLQIIWKTFFVLTAGSGAY